MPSCLGLFWGRTLEMGTGFGQPGYGYLTLRDPPAQARKHAVSTKNALLSYKGDTAADKESEEILEALVVLRHTLGVAWLLPNQDTEACFNLKRQREHEGVKELHKEGVWGLPVSEKDHVLLGAGPPWPSAG